MERQHTTLLPAGPSGVTANLAGGGVQLSVIVMTQPVNPTDGSSYKFSPRDIERLRVYRAAVSAGFYNEQTETAGGAQQVAQRESTEERRRRRCS
jgi:hypothetical protein